MMKGYEQMITIYGTIIVEAETQAEAKDKILSILQKGEIKFDDGVLLIGDFERLSDVPVEVENGGR